MTGEPSQFWRGVRWSLGGMSSLVIVLGVLAGMWAASGLPTMAWSTDISRLERGQLKISISFHHEKSVHLLEKKIIVRYQLEQELAKSADQKVQKYINSLKVDLEKLTKEEKRTEERIKELEARSLELGAKK